MMTIQRFTLVDQLRRCALPRRPRAAQTRLPGSVPVRIRLPCLATIGGGAALDCHRGPWQITARHRELAIMQRGLPESDTIPSWMTRRWGDDDRCNQCRLLRRRLPGGRRLGGGAHASGFSEDPE